jgi:glycosyltransferase involved in cell wall biosynthesis
MSIDILILTQNEQDNIRDCLASINGLGQAIVIDDNSTDETVNLALEAGAIVKTRTMDDFASQRNFALSVSQADWVFFLDADERFTPELLESIKARLNGPKIAGRALTKNFAFGRRFRFGHLAPGWVTRLFPRSEVKWTGLVHETAETSLPVVSLSGDLEHHTYRSWDHFLSKMHNYAYLWGKWAAENGKSSSVFHALLKGGFNFFKTLFIKLGILDGPYGWAVSAVAAHYTLSKYLVLNSLGQKKGQSE